MKSRVLHPSFFTDEKIRQLSPNAKVLLLGLWLRCDDHGRAIERHFVRHLSVEGQ